MDTLRAVPGSEAWTLVSVQALNRFYIRGDSTIVANWMTRQDRDQAIADNIEYVDRVLDHLGRNVSATDATELSLGPTFVLGFSQGAAMAYRAALLGRHRVDGIIVVGGDVPPDVKSVPAARWPHLLVAAGNADHWYTPDKVAADESFLGAHGVTHEIFHYQAGHVFTDAVHARIASFITKTN